jgi:mono/diheme cytochrome c family protein
MAILLTLGAGFLFFGRAAPLPAQDKPAKLLSAESAGLSSRCARCHGNDGSGSAARDQIGEIPNFSSHKWQTSRSDTQLLESILNGKGSHMPSFRGKLSDKEAREMVSQIRALDPEKAESRSELSSGDFETRFRELQKELEELKKQLRELTRGREQR